MHKVFIEKKGLELLHDMLCEAETPEQQIEIAEPFFRLAKKIKELAKVDSTEPPLPSTEVGWLIRAHDGDGYIDYRSFMITNLALFCFLFPRCVIMMIAVLSRRAVCQQRDAE